MKRKKVDSSNLASVGYDEKTKTLEIRFQKGGVYQYSGVPKRTYTRLMAASSLGSFFHKYIKETYAFTKVG